MSDWNTHGKYVFAGVLIVMGLVGLARGRHSYGGWTGDFFDGDGEVVLGGWKAFTLNLSGTLCGVAILFGLGWFLFALSLFLVLRKLVAWVHENEPVA